MKRKQLLFVGGPLALLMGAVFAFVGIPDSAFATVCGTGNYQVDYYVPTNFADGVRVLDPGMNVFNASQSCTYGSTIVVFNSSGNWVETGWYEDPDGELDVCDSTSGTPKLFVAAYASGNTWGCKHPAPTVSNGDHEVSVNDFNEDTVWIYWWDGTNEGSYDLTWSEGEARDNGERHTLDSSNPNGGVFEGLQLAIGGAGWGDWFTTTAITPDTDTGYKGCKYSNTFTTVIPNSSTC